MLSVLANAEGESLSSWVRRRVRVEFLKKFKMLERVAIASEGADSGVNP